jgi:GGDEF domain-containing protein
MTAKPGVPSERAGAAAEGFDPTTGFALPARFAMRVRDVLGSGAGSLLIVSCTLENAAALGEHNAVYPLRVLLQLGDLLRSQLPFSHTLARTGEAQLCALLPNPGDDPEALGKQLAAAVARRVSEDPALSFPTPAALAFGFAQAPRDGADADVLLREACRPRLRMRRSAA